ncbi:XkdF-like putative serine protease domain-containing protein [bacterium]|nr:XkdF-like putative serine protease domain-containing protein [bacterium]MDB4245991.1 XkdF-like putative serine protease domain-containing protein [bacterium]
MDTIELIIDEQMSEEGINAISLVEFPAIEENFVALSKHKVEFKTLNEEKRIIVGLALVPDKLIYRRKGDYEYNITFSKETVRKASELYLKRLKNNNTTLEHQELTSGVSVIESWIVEDPNKDKTALYGLNAVEGAWAVTMKIDNDDVWNDVKEGRYLGLSIEGIFSDKENLSSEIDEMTEEEAIMALQEIKKYLENESEVL